MSDARFNWLRFLVIAGLVLLLVALLGYLFFDWVGDFVVFRTIDYVVDGIVGKTGASPFLVKGLVVLLIGPFFMALREVGRIPLFGPTGWLPKKVAWALIVCYVSGYFLTMWAVSRNAVFVHHGETLVAAKYYAVTPEGCELFDSPGFHPKYGIKLEPATPDVVLRCAAREKGVALAPLTYPPLPVCFDSITGEARVWYHRKSSGDIELYPVGGFHPSYGVELKPVTRDIVSELERIVALQEAARAQQQEAREASDRRQAAERAAAEQESAREATIQAQQESLASLLPDLSPNSRDTLDVAIGVLDAQSGWDTGTAQILADSIRRERPGLRVRPLGRGFAAAETFRGAFDGQGLRGVDLSEYADLLLLASKTTNFGRDRSLANIVTARTSLEVRLVNTRSWSIQDRISETQLGAGPAAPDAEQQAVERIAEHIVGFF